MDQGLVVASFAGLGAMLGWGIADFLAKKTIDKIGDVTTLFWGQLLGIIPLAFLFALHPSLPDFSHGGWVMLVVLGAWSGLSYIPTYMAFGKGEVSLLSPIFASYGVVVAVLAPLLLGEVIPSGVRLAFLIVFIGVVLISTDPRELWGVVTRARRSGERVKGLKEILFAVAFYSLWLITLDSFISGKDWVPVLLGIRTCSAAALFLFARATGRKLAFRDASLWKYLLTIGVFDVAAFGFVSYGFSATSHASVVTMLSGAFSLPTIVLAHVFLKEKATRLQMAGSLVVVAGIMLLAFLR